MRRLEQPVALTTILHVLGEFFKIQRITRGDKQRTVSRAVGVTQGVISQIEQGTYHGLTVSLTMRMLAYYGLRPALPFGRASQEGIFILRTSSVAVYIKEHLCRLSIGVACIITIAKIQILFNSNK